MAEALAWQIKVDPAQATPIWSQLVTEIRHNIARFRPEPGTAVISERKLAETLGLHRNTVRQAYAELLDKQILARRNCRAIVVGPQAKDLYKKPFPTISLIMHRQMSELFKEFTKQSLEIFGSLLDHASALGISVNIVVLPPIDAGREEIDFWIEKNLTRSIGVINFGPRTYRCSDPVFNQLTGMKDIPQVLVLGSAPDNNVSNVFDDNEPGFREMLEELRRNGHRKLAVFNWKIRSLYYSSAVNRGATLIDLAPQYGIVPQVYSIDSFQTSEEQLGDEIARNLDQLFASPDHPTAIWGQNDYTAKIIYDQLTARGIAIPEDISLIGYDNDTGGLLASVNYSRSDLGKELVEIIWHMYNSGKSDTVIHRGIPSKFYPNKTIGKCKS
ncbi:MAG: GntR family transcriptional regulator [Lentisphaerae bacterium]|nr:GntR family transcriptional regulator [Lentisphaerota bacterium]